MFGINSVEQVGLIIEGWSNYALGREKELSESRMKICRECPLYNAEKDTCDNKKCWDKANEKLVDYPGQNIVCGCGCVMAAATKSKSKKCVLGKW